MTKLGEACLIEKGQDEEKGFFFFFLEKGFENAQERQ